MVIDLSSKKTPSFKPMDGYASPMYSGGGMAGAWKGFFVESLMATLPNDFTPDSDPVSAEAYSILIDDLRFYRWCICQKSFAH